MALSKSKSQNIVTKKHKAVELILRMIMSLIGVFLIAVGATFLEEGAVGLDPFTATNIGLSKIFNMSLGSVQLSFNIIIFIIVLILDRHQMGIGTVFNMTLVGFGIQIFSQIYQEHITGLYLPLLIVDALVGIILFTLGTSFYMEVHLGVAPYDALAPIISEITHLKYQWVRSAQDIAFMIFGFLVGGDIGIMTIVIAFFAGPLITLWNVHVSSHLINAIESFSGDEKKAKHVKQGTINIAKYSVASIMNAYQNTNKIESQIDDYSIQRVDDMMHATSNQLKWNVLAYNALRHRYYILRKAMINKKSKT